MAVKRVQKKIDWSAEEQARHQAVRDTFKDNSSLEELVARGELTGKPIPLGAYLNLRLLAWLEFPAKFR